LFSSYNRAIIEFFRTNPIVIGPLTVAHITSIVMIIVALIVRNVIKDKQTMSEEDIQSNAIKACIYEYILIVLVGVIGFFIYYNVHSRF
jgi:phosphatidylglycerol:prolipoprotein diacylglycerol transferase